MRNPYFQKVWLLWFSISWNESPLSLLSSLFFLLSLSTSHFGEWLSATIFPCPCSYFLLVYAWLSSPYILMYQNAPTEWMYCALDINIGWISITQALHRLHSHSLASFLLSFLEWCKCTASKYHTTTIVKMANKSPPVPVS